jgi:hypothetical protein
VAVVATLALAQVRSVLTSRATLAAVGIYIFVVGLIYTLLLRSLWAPTGLHRIADALLHDLVPVAYLLWWTGFAPRGGLGWSQPLRWLAYPFAYFVFWLVLGAATGRYRSPFAEWPRSDCPPWCATACSCWRCSWRWGSLPSRSIACCRSVQPEHGRPPEGRAAVEAGRPPRACGPHAPRGTRLQPCGTPMSMRACSVALLTSACASASGLSS